MSLAETRNKEVQKTADHFSFDCDKVNSLTIRWERQNESCAHFPNASVGCSHPLDISRSEYLSKTDKRHAAAWNGMLRFAAHATACNGTRNAEQRDVTACVGMHRSGLFVGFEILKFGSQVWYDVLPWPFLP